MVRPLHAKQDFYKAQMPAQAFLHNNQKGFPKVVLLGSPALVENHFWKCFLIVMQECSSSNSTNKSANFIPYGWDAELSSGMMVIVLPVLILLVMITDGSQTNVHFD